MDDVSEVVIPHVAGFGNFTIENVNVIRAVPDGKFEEVMTRFFSNDGEKQFAFRSIRAGITQNHLRILKLLCQGYDNKEIAQESGYSPQTVKNYLTHLFAATGVSDRVNLLLWANKHGHELGEPRTHHER